MTLIPPPRIMMAFRPMSVHTPVPINEAPGGGGAYGATMLHCYRALCDMSALC